MELLSAEEIRIIGSLIEKEYSTPEYYPMTINSLKNACNQKSSRNPVVNYDENIVEVTVLKLQDKKLVSKVTGPELRVPKYKQIFSHFYNLTVQQSAVMCVLFLRGPQTIGEIRSRSHRIYEFKDLEETSNTIDQLIERDNDPFIIKLPKDSGREYRYTHLFEGEPVINTQQSEESNAENRIAELENKVISLEEMLVNLKEEFDQFKQAFE